LIGTDYMTKLFLVEEKHSVKIDDVVYDSIDNNTRYVFENSYYYPISSSSTKAEFTFVTEHQIKALAEPEGIDSLFSSDWYSLSHLYSDGSQISYNAPSEVQYSLVRDTKYRFSYWTLPGNQKQIDNKLVLSVNKGGEIIANYDTYYKLTINSLYGGDIEGEGFYLAGDTAKWRIKSYTAPPAEDFFGYYLGIKQMPIPGEDEVKMDSPKIINIHWVYDYSSLTAPILWAIIGCVIGGLIVWKLLRSRNSNRMP
jgi:hypothetical protein